MERIDLQIIAAGNRKTPAVWQQPCITNIQRLYYIKGGTGYIHTEDGGRIPFEKNSIYIFPHNLPQSFEADNRDPLDHIYFDFLSTPPIIAPEPLVYRVIPQSTLEGAVAFFGGLLQERQKEESGEKQRLLSAALELLLRLLDKESPLPLSQDRVIARALAYIHGHYRAPLTVAELARREGFAPNAFIRRFKRVMGQTPYAYLKDYRLMRAAALLKEGMTVARAAELVGYENASSLSRALAKKG